MCNVYTRSREVETLQMIFAEIIGKESGNQGDNWIGQDVPIIMSRMRQPPQPTTTVLSKQLLGIILCYEIESYSMKILSLTNIVKKYSLSS